MEFRRAFHKVVKVSWVLCTFSAAAMLRYGLESLMDELF
jgi:hypothetical protein